MSNWEGLDEFVAVAECGQFTAAAERLGLSSSQISRQVARLEELPQPLLPTLFKKLDQWAQAEADMGFAPSHHRSHQHA